MEKIIEVVKTADGGEIWKMENGTVKVQSPEWVKYRDRARAQFKKDFRAVKHIKLTTGKIVA